VNSTKVYVGPEDFQALLEWWKSPVTLEEQDPSIPKRLEPGAPSE